MTRVGVFPTASALSCLTSAGFHSFPWFLGVFTVSSRVERGGHIDTPLLAEVNRC